MLADSDSKTSSPIFPRSPRPQLPHPNHPNESAQGRFQCMQDIPKSVVRKILESEGVSSTERIERRGKSGGAQEARQRKERSN